MLWKKRAEVGGAEVIYEHEWQRCEAMVEDRVAVAGAAVETRQLKVVGAEDTAEAVASGVEDSEGA
jgi:hypothetical protein